MDEPTVEEAVVRNKNETISSNEEDKKTENILQNNEPPKSENDSSMLENLHEEKTDEVKKELIIENLNKDVSCCQ